MSIATTSAAQADLDGESGLIPTHAENSGVKPCKRSKRGVLTPPLEQLTLAKTTAFRELSYLAGDVRMFTEVRPWKGPVQGP